MTAILSAILWLLARLPAPARQVFVRAATFFYSVIARDTRATIATNLTHVADGLASRGVRIDSVDEFVRQNMRATVELLPETALCWRGPPDGWRRLVGTVHGDEAIALLTQARAAQKSATDGAQRVLLLSPHLGNWELLNMYLGHEFGLTVLYDPPRLAALEPLIRDARQRTDSTLLPIGPAGLRAMVQRLRRGWVVGLLPDQVPGVDAGVLADFFGKQALTINLVHRLVERHGPRVFLVCALRGADGRFDIHFDELTQALTGVSEAESAVAMNQAIERRVAQAPEQYQWSYKRFKRVTQNAPNIYRRAATNGAKTQA